MTPGDQEGAPPPAPGPIEDGSAARPADYPFSRWGEALQEAAPKLSGRPRHCAVNALRGLKRAWRIAPLDPEIALFRAITAEEEAATALMAALKVRAYPGAEKLQLRSHPQKAGLYPFLLVMESVFAESKFPTPKGQLQYEQDGPPRLDVHIASEDLGLGPGGRVTPDEPLNLVVRAGRRGDPATHVETFEDRLGRYAAARGFGSMLQAVQAAANLRNRVLYACDQGIAAVQDIDADLLARQRPVILMTTLTIAILQTRKHQLLAVQGLEAFLKMLERLPETPFDFDAALGEPAELMIDVSRSEGGRPTARLTARGA